MFEFNQVGIFYRQIWNCSENDVSRVRLPGLYTMYKDWYQLAIL